VIEVRRDSDGELCGHVVSRTDGWHALTVFGGQLGVEVTQASAVACVLERGLASLAERWQLRAAHDDETQVVCIQEADPTGVTLALDHYSLPGVPTKRITRAQLDTGEWVLTR
jgi:hypothetical protein